MLTTREEHDLRTRLHDMMMDLVDEFNVGFSVVIDPYRSDVQISTKRTSVQRDTQL